MTNSPPFDEQLALAKHWALMKGTFLPGTSRPSDRFARALHNINHVPKSDDPRVALAQLRGILHAVSVPLGMLKVSWHMCHIQK
jgi:penicillin V acylase-like amidase (Ntn superfamily)